MMVKMEGIQVKLEMNLNREEHPWSDQIDDSDMVANHEVHLLNHFDELDVKHWMEVN